MANLIFAWLVHLYTALGAVVGLYSILAIDESNFRLAFFLMAVTVIIDATDGALARAARVKRVIPWFDGALLDNLVDYLNYVIVPCLFLLRAALLPPQDALWLAALPVLSSAYGFCRRDAKTADHFFLGFPSYWNIVVFYLYALKPRSGSTPLRSSLCRFMVFVPIVLSIPAGRRALLIRSNIAGALWGAAILVSHLPSAGSATMAFVGLAYISRLLYDVVALARSAPYLGLE